MRSRARRPLSPRVRQRRTLLSVILLGLLLVAFLFAFVFPTQTFLRQRTEISSAERRLQELERQTRELERDNGRLHGDGEIERMAREQYGLVRPGETPFVLVPQAPSATTTTTPPPLPAKGQP